MHDTASQWEIEENPGGRRRADRTGRYQLGPLEILRLYSLSLMLAGGCFVVGLIFAGIAYHGATRIYEATGTFLVDELPFVQTVKQNDSETDRQVVQSLILSIANRDMRIAVEKRLGLAPGRIAFAGLDRPLKFRGSQPEANVQVALVKNSRLGMISADSQSSEFSAQIVNAILDELGLYNLIGGKLKAIQISAGFVKAQAESMLLQLAEVNAQRIKLGREIAEMETYLKQKLPLSSYPAFSQDATLNNLKTQLIIVKSEYKYLAISSTRGQRLIGKEAELDTLRAQMDRQAGNLAEALRAEYAIRSTQELDLQANKLKAAERLDGLSQESTRLAQSFGDPALMRKLAAETGKEGETGNANMVVVVNRASPPSRAIRPQLAIYLLLGGALGGMIGIVVAASVALLDIGLKSVAQIETQLGLPCLAVLPKEEKIGAGIRDVTRDFSDVPAGLGFLRGILLSPLEKRNFSVVGFSPASPKQRSTELVADLAILLAQAGKRVLVVDLHFEDPLLADTLGVKVTGCIEGWIRSNDPISTHLSRSILGNLAILSARGTDKNLEDAISRRPLTAQWPSIASDWDFVLIDAPCILTDWSLSLSLPTQSPLILTADFNRTKMNHLSQVCYHARGLRWHLEGVVMTHAPRSMTT